MEEPGLYRAPASGPAEKVSVETTQINAVCAWCKFRRKPRKDTHGREEPLFYVLREAGDEHHGEFITVEGKTMRVVPRRFGGPRCLVGVKIDPVLGAPASRSTPHTCAEQNDSGQCTDYQPTWLTVLHPFRSLPIAKEHGR